MYKIDGGVMNGDKGIMTTREHQLRMNLTVRGVFVVVTIIASTSPSIFTCKECL